MSKRFEFEASRLKFGPGSFRGTLATFGLWSWWSACLFRRRPSNDSMTLLVRMGKGTGGRELLLTSLAPLGSLYQRQISKFRAVMGFVHLNLFFLK